METLRTDAFAAEAWDVSQWLSVKNSAVFMGGVADGTRAAGQYSNTRFDVAAAVVEAVAGEKWDTFLKRRILDPLGMTNTSFMPTNAQLNGHVEFYVFRGGRKTKWLYEE